MNDFDHMGVWLVRVTAGIAVAGWLIRVLMEDRACRLAHPRFVWRFWAVGAAFALIHVIAAFGFVHGWSLDQAMRHTANQMQAVVGFGWPQAVYLNSVFVAAWILDVIRESKRVTHLGWFRHSVWGVMMVNATVVFGPRYWGFVALVAVGVLVWRKTAKGGDEKKKTPNDGQINPEA